MKLRNYVAIGVCVILIVKILNSFFIQPKLWENSLSQEFKSLGLKGDLKVIDTTKEIEAYYGTRVKLNYTEKFSDGYVLNENTQADIREPSGEHGADLYFDLSSKIEPLLNVKEKELFDIVKRNEFNFLLDVYEKRPGFKLEEDKIKKDIANKINELFNEKEELEQNQQDK